VRFEIYHQLGFQHKWNLQSIAGDATGDGTIIGGRWLERKAVDALPEYVRSRAMFDPQFFLPSQPKGSLTTYDFFPQLAADGFQSSDYAEESAGISASRCVAFQRANDFRFIVIPTRYMAGMPGNFIATQEELFVSPFLAAIEEQECATPALVQLVLTENMLKDDDYAADLLNWITGLGGIAGVYLIVEASSTSKQVKDADLLFRVLRFVAALRDNELLVVLGYLNTEAVVLSLADPSIVTMGVYENTRSFRIRTFDQTESPPHGPNPRLYFSQCLQWIEHNYHGAIRRQMRDRDLFDDNKYNAKMFEPSFQWHFSKPELYKHHFLEFSRQLRQVAVVEGAERYVLVRQMICHAMASFDAMDRAGIVLSSENDGSHLPLWLTAMNEFANEQGWRQ
jgi:hypothetical protein